MILKLLIYHFILFLFNSLSHSLVFVTAIDIQVLFNPYFVEDPLEFSLIFVLKAMV